MVIAPAGTPPANGALPPPPMPLRKSHLYSSLWQSCDQLRGGMDASQYKDYVLTLLFMKYVSDKYAGSGDFADITVPPGGSFADMVDLKGTKEIGDGINKVIGRLADANDFLLKGVIDQADFLDESKLGKGKEMQDRLTELVGIFQALDFRANRAHGDDLLGDAYEYLMRHFATQSGKSKGQFYTPAEVSRIMAQVIGIGPDTKRDHTVFDPTCGSGSLLIKAADEAPNGLTIYGQEMDVATWRMARMNMILHGRVAAEIQRGNTLATPYFKDGPERLKRFHFAVANPPFSMKAWSNGLDPANDEYRRFEYGQPPAKNGDFAFLLHLVASLNSTGKGAIIMPHGVLFRGNREADIRRNLVKRGLIKGVIGLPANLFYGTGIPACIVVIGKENAVGRRGIFMIDASKGFQKDGAKNRLRERDIHRIVDVFTEQREAPGYSRMVPLAEIASEANDYNLNIPRYIDSSEGRTCTTCPRTCMVASRTATSALSATTGRCFRACGSCSSRRMAGKGTATRGSRRTRCGGSCSNTGSSRRMGTGSAGCLTVGGGSMRRASASLPWRIRPRS